LARLNEIFTGGMKKMVLKIKAESSDIFRTLKKGLFRYYKRLVVS
jgi:hypothetical protein